MTNTFRFADHTFRLEGRELTVIGPGYRSHVVIRADDLSELADQATSTLRKLGSLLGPGDELTVDHTTNGLDLHFKLLGVDDNSHSLSASLRAS